MSNTATSLGISAVAFMIIKVTFRSYARNKMEQKKLEKNPVVIKERAKYLEKTTNTESVSRGFLKRNYSQDFDASNIIEPAKFKRTGNKVEDAFRVICDALGLHVKTATKEFLLAYQETDKYNELRKARISNHHELDVVLNKEEAAYNAITWYIDSQRVLVNIPLSITRMNLFNGVNKALKKARLPMVLTDCEYSDLQISSDWIEIKENDTRSSSDLFEELIRVIDKNDIVLLDLARRNNCIELFAMPKDKYDRFMKAVVELGLNFKRLH